MINPCQSCVKLDTDNLIVNIMYFDGITPHNIEKRLKLRYPDLRLAYLLDRLCHCRDILLDFPLKFVLIGTEL